MRQSKNYAYHLRKLSNVLVILPPIENTLDTAC